VVGGTLEKKSQKRAIKPLFVLENLKYATQNAQNNEQFSFDLRVVRSPLRSNRVLSGFYASKKKVPAHRISLSYALALTESILAFVSFNSQDDAPDVRVYLTRVLSG